MGGLGAGAMLRGDRGQYTESLRRLFDSVPKLKDELAAHERAASNLSTLRYIADQESEEKEIRLSARKPRGQACYQGDSVHSAKQARHADNKSFGQHVRIFSAEGEEHSLHAQSDDVVVSVDVHTRMVSGRRFGADHQYPTTWQRYASYEFLGRNKLTALVDMLQCPSDALGQNPGSFLFVEGTFYNDMRSEAARDESEGIRKWLEEVVGGSEDDLGMPAPQVENAEAGAGAGADGSRRGVAAAGAIAGADGDGDESSEAQRPDGERTAGDKAAELGDHDQKGKGAKGNEKLSEGKGKGKGKATDADSAFDSDLDNHSDGIGSSSGSKPKPSPQSTPEHTSDANSISNGYLGVRRKYCFGLREVSTANMNDVTFAELKLKLGRRYLYLHQGDCEHHVYFTDIRLVRPSDTRDITQYAPEYQKDKKKKSSDDTLNRYYQKPTFPIRTFSLRTMQRKCPVCLLFSAKYVTIDDSVVPGALTKKEYCEDCFRKHHYSSEGDLLAPFIKTAFKVLPILDPIAMETRAGCSHHSQVYLPGKVKDSASAGLLCTGAHRSGGVKANFIDL